MLTLSAKTPTTDNRPEVQLLLCCTRAHMDAENAQQLKTILQNDIDWTYLLQTAARHGVLPLLYWNLNNTCPEAVPKATLYQLRDYFHNNSLRNLFLTKELLKLLSLFKTHDIPAIPFKGPVLAALAYDNLALRQFGDLDILVRKQDFLKAKDLLICQGYRHLYFGEHEAAYLQSQLLRADGQVSVDLHRGITPRDFFFSLDPEPMWEYLQPVSLMDTNILTFSPEDSLLVMYAHGSKEDWLSLNRICDLAQLIRTYPDMNWERLMKQVRTLGCERGFCFSLLLASELLEANLPEYISQKIHAIPLIKQLAAQVIQRLFGETEVWLIVFEELLKTIVRVDRWSDRFSSFLRMVIVPTPTDQAFLPLPKFLEFLYYPIRCFRVIVKYGLLLSKHYLTKIKTVVKILASSMTKPML